MKIRKQQKKNKENNNAWEVHTEHAITMERTTRKIRTRQRHKSETK